MHPDELNQSQKLTVFEEFKSNFVKTWKLSKLHLEEQNLFYQLFDLFALQNGIGDQKIILDLLNQPRQGILIEHLGMMGVGKSTSAKDIRKDFSLANHFGSSNSVRAVAEPYNNPFRGLSQNDSDFMLHSQLLFLLFNLQSSVEASLFKGISVSDSSALTDSEMWAPWYHQVRKFKENEFKLYQRVVKLFKPLFQLTKPNLLVILQPDSIGHLMEGIRRRKENEPERAAELNFTEEDFEQQQAIVHELISIIPGEFGIPVLTYEVNPLNIREDPYIGFNVIYEVRKSLDLLGELIRPSADEVMDNVMKLILLAGEPLVIIIDSPSMFTQKTAVLCKLPEKLGGTDNVIAFQPEAAKRELNQEGQLINRDGLTLEAIMIKSNNLQSVLDYLAENHIDPKKKPFILIDEIMLFYQNSGEEALQILENLRNLGFNVIVDGVNYTFQGEPFTFMHDLLVNTRVNANWHHFTMKTRCRWCGLDAEVTRRWKVNPETGERIGIANFGDEAYVAGDSEYEPVCGTVHVSCVGQPMDFVRQELPV